MLVYLVVLFFLLCTILFIVNRDSIKEKIEPSEVNIQVVSPLLINDDDIQTNNESHDLELESAFTNFVKKEINVKPVKGFKQVADFMNA
jgi:hypothetical protein